LSRKGSQLAAGHCVRSPGGVQREPGFFKRFHSETYFRDVLSHGCDQFLRDDYIEISVILAMD
jgi:hypothetical protein